jgi:hypothetical protein
METNTKIMIGVGVVGLGALAWYLKSKSATPVAAATPASAIKSAQLASGPVVATSSPASVVSPAPAAIPSAPAVVQLAMTSDGTAVVRAPVGSKLVPSNSLGMGWDPEDALRSSVPGVLTANGDGTFTASSTGGTAVNGSALASNGDSYPMSATVIVV